jgi:hypothetical protein
LKPKILTTTRHITLAIYRKVSGKYGESEKEKAIISETTSWESIVSANETFLPWPTLIGAIPVQVSLARRLCLPDHHEQSAWL